MPVIHRALALVADLLFPHSCALCDRTPIDGDSDWCPSCTHEVLAAVSTDYCHRCGETTEPHLVDDRGCRHCRDRCPPTAGVARVATYESAIGEMIRRYKYHGQQRLDAVLGRMLADAIRGQPWSAGIDALVPVPASLIERLHYHFYPVGLLANVASHRLGLPVLPLLTIHGKTRRQTELIPSDRAANVRGKFHLARRANVSGACLCLVDDVTTSGSTLAECARVLKRAGAAEVYTAVLAKAGHTHAPNV